VEHGTPSFPACDEIVGWGKSSFWLKQANVGDKDRLAIHNKMLLK